MSVTINAKGTSVPTFMVGKAGLQLSQAGEISPPAGNDLTINLDEDKTLIVNAGIAGPALITTSNDQDLHINPAVGGGQYLVLVANRWPGADGTANQILKTNGSGVLSWYSPVPNYEEFSATAAQTIFNTTMTTTAKAGGKAYLQIFVNGVFQQEGATKQFTVTGGNQITFNAGLSLNDDVVVYGYV